MDICTDYQESGQSIAISRMQCANSWLPSEQRMLPSAARNLKLSACKLKWGVANSFHRATTSLNPALTFNELLASKHASKHRVHKYLRENPVKHPALDVHKQERAYTSLLGWEQDAKQVHHT